MKVWTFIIRGGTPLSLSPRGRLGPRHEHPGAPGRSIWQFVGTKEEAEAVEALLTGPLVQATVQCTTQEHDPEAQDEEPRMPYQGEF